MARPGSTLCRDAPPPSVSESESESESEGTLCPLGYTVPPWVQCSPLGTMCPQGHTVPASTPQTNKPAHPPHPAHPFAHAHAQMRSRRTELFINSVLHSRRTELKNPEQQRHTNTNLPTSRPPPPPSRLRSPCWHVRPPPAPWQAPPPPPHPRQLGPS